MRVKEPIRTEIKNVLEETTRFSFPFFSNKEKKKIIMQEKKFYIEEKLRTLAPERFPSKEKKDAIWIESLEYVNKQFKSLPIDTRLNGFYLQELMHYYAERLGICIIDND